MNSIVRWIFLSLMLCSSAVMAKMQAEADTFLWQVKKDGLPVSYLLGTIHLGKTGDILPLPVQKRLSESNVLVLESEVLPEESLSAETLAVMQRMLDPDRRLPALLGKDYAKKIQRCRIDSEQKDKDTLLYFQPWAAMMLCSYALPDGVNMEFGVDYLLSEGARESNIRVLPLESTEEMLAYFEQIPEQKALALLKLNIDHYAEMQKLNKNLIEDYARNRFKKIAAENLDEKVILKFFPKEDRAFWSNWFYGKLLAQRNQKWLPKLVETLNQEPAFIAVGAAHLAGEDGLIKLLRQEGFTVTPVFGD